MPPPGTPQAASGRQRQGTAATEQQVSFACGGQVLHGILHGAAAVGSAPGQAVIMLHGWGGCRLGPHRMFVDFARNLAAQGVSALRFDFRGRGESEGDLGSACLDSMIADTRAALAFLRERLPGSPRIVLLGLCSGAEVALGAAADPAVSRLALWSAPLVGPREKRNHDPSARGFLRRLRPYLRKLASPATWRKILAGDVHVGQVRRAVAGAELPEATVRARREEQARILAAFRAFRGDCLFIHGSADPGALEVQASYRDLCRLDGRTAAFHVVEGANHNFYSLAWKGEVFRLTADWIVAFTEKIKNPIKIQNS